MVPELLQAQFSVLTHNEEIVIAPEIIQQMQQYYQYLNEEPAACCFSSDFLRDKEQLCAAWDKEPNSSTGQMMGFQFPIPILIDQVIRLL